MLRTQVYQRIGSAVDGAVQPPLPRALRLGLPLAFLAQRARMRLRRSAGDDEAPNTAQQSPPADSPQPPVNP
jgi:hypothetical protein